MCFGPDLPTGPGGDLGRKLASALVDLNQKTGDHCFWENKMMQRNVCYSAIAATIPAWLLSAPILISAAQFNVAEAQIIDQPR